MLKKQLKNFIPAIIDSIHDLVEDREKNATKLYLNIKSIGTFSFFLSNNRYTFEGETINSCSPRRAFIFMNAKNIGAYIC